MISVQIGDGYVVRLRAYLKLNLGKAEYAPAIPYNISRLQLHFVSSISSTPFPSQSPYSLSLYKKCRQQRLNGKRSYVKRALFHLRRVVGD